MHLKANGYSFGVFLIYTITVIRLPAVGWCEPPPPTAKPDSHHVRIRGVTTRGRSDRSRRDGGRGHQLGPRQADEQWAHLPVFNHLENRDGSQPKPSGGGRPEQRLRTGTAPPLSDKMFQNPHKQTEEDWVYWSLDLADEDCGQGQIQRVVHGRFYIPGQLEVNVPRVRSQPDSAAPGQAVRIRDQQVRSLEESWQRLQPVVECGDDAMTLTVRRRQAVQLQLDRVNESSVPLSQLPRQCGYSVQTTLRDLSMMVQYNSCHVTHENERYVLPLLWRGTPVKISCPVSQIQPQDAGLSSLCCSSSGMTVKVQGPSATEELRVNVRGEWTPLMVLAEQCGYTLDRRQAAVIITAPFITCGITVKDGKRTLFLQIGEKMFTLSCPISPSHEELPQTQEPLIDISHYGTRELTEPLPESMEPFPWAPPFYLAPLYYPHPTYHHKYSRPYVHDAYNPPTTPLSTPDPAFNPQPLPDSQDSPQILVRWSNKHFSPHSSLPSTDVMEDSSQMYPDWQKRQETPVLSVPESSSGTTSSFLTEAPSLQPPSHAFNPYYHYYHHPKIPLPGPPQNPDPGPDVAEELSATNSYNHEIPVLPVCVQESEVNSDQFPQPVLETPYTLQIPEFVHKAPESHAPYLPHPYPHHFFYYFPYINSGEAKQVAPVHPDMAAETKKSHVHSLPHKYMNPYINHPNEMRNDDKHPFFSEEDVKPALDDTKGHSAPVTPLPPSYPPKPHPVTVPPPEQPSVPTPSSNHDPPHPYYYYPYYQYYYGPGILHSAENHPSQTSTKPLDKHQTTPPATHSLSVQNSLLNPYYYYYHHYYQPEVTVDDQGLRPAGIADSGQAGSQLPSENSKMDLLAHADEAGYVCLPQLLYSPFHSFYPFHVSQQHPYDPFGHPSGEKDRLEANAPSAPRCALGLDCSNSLGCCLYSVHDCTVGQHFVLVVPDCVLEPVLAPFAHPCEGSNVSCSLEKLTSDPDIYIVPLDGCGVSKHVFGGTVGYLLEVHGTHPGQPDHTSVQEKSPVRMMVECSSSPGSPGEVRLHMMDQPPSPPAQSAPATVTVQLRIATDQSFTSYHPEAHLPLSLLQGKPLYLEVSLLDPPEPDLVLLVHSCLAYTHTPYSSWMPVYNGCPSQRDLQRFPSLHSDSHHIRRIAVSSFLSLPSESPSDTVKRGSFHLEDPEIYFLCLTELCFAADNDCTVTCINSPNSEQ